MKETIKSTHGVVRFSLKESFKSLQLSPNKESLIMLHFTSKGKRFKKSIGFKCSLNQWDSTKQRVKTGKAMRANAYNINSFLNNIQAFTEDQLSKMVRDTGLIDIERLSYLVSCKINGVDADVEQIENSKITFYSKKLIEAKKSNISITTYRSYNQTLNLLKLYEKKYATTLRFEVIDLVFYRSFVNFLEAEGFRLNSIGKHVKNLKTFLNDALINGITNNMTFKSHSFKILKEVTTDIYLTSEEIKTLANKDFSLRPKIELARDIFLIGCYTGQRVSDYNGLTDNNIKIIDGEKLIVITQKKTANKVKLPITKKIENIMNRYDGHFPPKLSEPILRKNIKTACYLAGFKELITNTYTKGGEKIKKETPKYKLVKTHTARRSFCTNHYKKGKSIQAIMVFSGHLTEKEFYKYVRMEREEKALAIIKNGFFDD